MTIDLTDLQVRCYFAKLTNFGKLDEFKKKKHCLISSAFRQYSLLKCHNICNNFFEFEARYSECHSVTIFWGALGGCFITVSCSEMKSLVSYGEERGPLIHWPLYLTKEIFIQQFWCIEIIFKIIVFLNC